MTLFSRDTDGTVSNLLQLLVEHFRAPCPAHGHVKNTVLLRRVFKLTSRGKYVAWELARGRGNHWEHEKYCAWETHREHGNTKLEAAQGHLGNPMGTWEHGNMGSDEATWEHSLGIKTTENTARVFDDQE